MYQNLGPLRSIIRAPEHKMLGGGGHNVPPPVQSRVKSSGIKDWNILVMSIGLLTYWHIDRTNKLQLLQIKARLYPSEYYIIPETLRNFEIFKSQNWYWNRYSYLNYLKSEINQQEMSENKGQQFEFDFPLVLLHTIQPQT